MNVRDALQQRLRKKMMRMRETLERFNDETAEAQMVGPNWNVRDLVGHFVFWTTESAAQMPTIAKGGKPPAYNLKRVNDDVYKKNRRMSYVMLLPQLRTAEDKLLDTLGRMPADQLVGDTPLREWVELQPDHYDHHWPGLKKAAEAI